MSSSAFSSNLIFVRIRFVPMTPIAAPRYCVVSSSDTEGIGSSAILKIVEAIVRLLLSTMYESDLHFFGFTVSLAYWQNSSVVRRSRSIPCSESDNSRMSSAYANTAIPSSAMWYPSSLAALVSLWRRGSMHMLNCVGESGQPCFTPVSFRSVCFCPVTSPSVCDSLHTSLG